MREPKVPAQLCALLFLLNASCDGGTLRGNATPSADGGTYLVVLDDNGGGCGPIYVDGRIWPHPIGAAGSVTPGTHTISCGTEVKVHVDSATTFRFDYWGP